MNNTFDLEESALVALSRMTIDDFSSLVAQKIGQFWSEESSGRSRAQKPYVTVEEAAELLCVSKRTFETLLSQGDVPPPVMGGGSGSKRIWRTEELLNLKRST